MGADKRVGPRLARLGPRSSPEPAWGQPGQAGSARLGWGVASAKRTLKVIVFERFY